MRLNQAARIGLNTVGGAMGVGGLFMVLFGIGRLIDPSSAANDAEPFAPPAQFDDTLWLTGLSFCAVVVGTWICVHLGRDS
jgi:hypothetical protein